MKRAMFSAALVVATCVPCVDLVFAGDALQSDPSHHKLELQNDCVRVMRARFQPGEKSDAFFDAKGVAVVALTGAKGFKVHLPDGTSRDLQPIPPGATWWAPGGKIAVENTSDAPVEYIVVEPQSACVN